MIDWVAAYNDLRWLLTLQRMSIALNLNKPLQQLLTDLYAQQAGRTDETYLPPLVDE